MKRKRIWTAERMNQLGEATLSGPRLGGGWTLGGQASSALAASTPRPQAVPVNRMDGQGLGQTLMHLRAKAVH